MFGFSSCSRVVRALLFVAFFVVVIAIGPAGVAAEDILAVACFEAKAKLTRFVFIHFEFSCHLKFLLGCFC